MPPEGVQRPPEDQIDALIKFVEGEFERADRNLKPDPGRVTARRMNRNEYSNTIRDLLGVDFRAEKDFPTDDSGHGFDNIGEVLTISPVLMEKYIAAAESIAARATRGGPAAQAARRPSITPRTRRSGGRTRATSKPLTASNGTVSTSSESVCPESALRMESR